MRTPPRPFGADCMILDVLKKTLDTAACRSTRDPAFHAIKPARSRYRPPET